MENPSDQIQQGKYYPLGKKTFWLFIIQYTFATFIFLISALLVDEFRRSIDSGRFSENLKGYDTLFTLISILLYFLWLTTFIISFIAARLKYATCKIMFDDAAFHIVSGILSRKETAMPYRRIQGVQIKQSFIFRILGVGHVVISSTTSLEQPSDAPGELNDEVISIMDYPLAKQTEKILADRAEIERMEIHNKS